MPPFLLEEPEALLFARVLVSLPTRIDLPAFTVVGQRFVFRAGTGLWWRGLELGWRRCILSQHTWPRATPLPGFTQLFVGLVDLLRLLLLVATAPLHQRATSPHTPDVTRTRWWPIRWLMLRSKSWWRIIGRWIPSVGPIRAIGPPWSIVVIVGHAEPKGRRRNRKTHRKQTT